MIIDQLAEYSQLEAGRALREDVAHHAKRALIDWFSALFPGIALAPGPQLMRTHAVEMGHGQSSLPGQRTTAFAATAAWINGSISHAAEFDDIFRDAVYHPGSPTIAAALAVAEQRGAAQGNHQSATKSPPASAWRCSHRITATFTPAERSAILAAQRPRQR